MMKGLKRGVALLVAPLAGLNVVDGFVPPPSNRPSSVSYVQAAASYKDYDSVHRRQRYAPIEFPCFGFGKAIASTLVVMSLALTVVAPLPSLAASDNGGASVGANAKITTGGASTLQSGRTIAITRGVNLDRSDFSNQNLKGVAFQQSIVRDANFENCNLVGASFFDATVDGSNFQNADLTQANFEMAQFNRANLKNAVVREMYVSGATLFAGIKDIENTDWSETYLRKDQQLYLCSHPTAKGTNPKTGVETRVSLMCPD